MKYAPAWDELKETLQAYIDLGPEDTYIRAIEVLRWMDELEDTYE